MEYSQVKTAAALRLPKIAPHMNQYVSYKKLLELMIVELDETRETLRAAQGALLRQALIEGELRAALESRHDGGAR